MKVQAEGRAVRGVLLCVVFAAGFVVTGIEIALGRLLSPHFGSSLTVWAAIMASVIGALSLGYPLGGWLADRRPSAGLPVAALLIGGLVGAFLGLAMPSWLRTAMLGVGLSGIAFWGRLAFVLLLFALPCIALASVPPAVLRTTLRARETAGRESGMLYALGSLGSVLGILLPALWWIPSLGIRATFLVLAALAVMPALAAIALGVVRVRVQTASAAAVAILAAGLLPNVIRLPPSDEMSVLYDRDSGIQRIRVVALDLPERRRRWLQLDEGWSTHSVLFEPDLVTGGVWDWMALCALAARPDDDRTDVLIVGLAGGTVSNLMTKYLAPLVPELAITGVEVDARVIDVADRYLGLDRSRLETVAADGRVWLRGSGRTFDLVILDAYRQPSIPAHLATREFFEEVRSHLAPGGLAVLNVFGPAGESRLQDGLSATWTAVFADAHQLVGPPAGAFASRLFFSRAIDSTEVVVPPLLRDGWDLIQAGTHPMTAKVGVALWTDDRAPVELLADGSFRELRPPNPGASRSRD